MLSAVLWGGLAAASLLVGYALAGRGLSNRTIGIVMGFGAGALLSAIAYELVPELALGGGRMGIAFLLGALTFFGADWWIDHRGGSDRKDIAGKQVGSGSAIFVGTLLDNVPEFDHPGNERGSRRRHQPGLSGRGLHLKPARGFSRNR